MNKEREERVDHEREHQQEIVDHSRDGKRIVNYEERNNDKIDHNRLELLSSRTRSKHKNELEKVCTEEGLNSNIILVT